METIGLILVIWLVTHAVTWAMYEKDDDSPSRSLPRLKCQKGHSFSLSTNHEFCPMDGTPVTLITPPKPVPPPPPPVPTCQKGHVFPQGFDYKFCPKDGTPVVLVTQKETPA